MMILSVSFEDILPEFLEEELEGLIVISGNNNIGPEKRWPARDGRGIPFRAGVFSMISKGLDLGEVVTFNATLNAISGHEDIRIDVNGDLDRLDYSDLDKRYSVAFNGDDTIVEHRTRRRAHRSRHVDEISRGAWGLVRFAYSGEMGSDGLVTLDGRLGTYQIRFDVSGRYKPLWSKSYYSGFSPTQNHRKHKLISSP